MEKACLPAIAKRFESMPADFQSDKRLQIAQRLTDMGAAPAGKCPRTALYLAANSLRRGSPAELNGYDGLSPDEKRTFCRRVFLGGFRIDEEWFESRLAPFAGHESAELYETAASVILPTVRDSADVLAAYIVAVRKAGIAVSDLTFKNMTWRGKPSKLERSVDKAGGNEGDLETYYEHSERPPEDKKGGFFGGNGGKDTGPREPDDRKADGRNGGEGSGSLFKGLKGLFKK
jgi:hypothetical protein